MMPLLFLLVGLALGIGAERLLGARTQTQAETGPAATRPPRRWGRILGWTSVVLVVVLLATAVGGYFWAKSVFDKIETRSFCVLSALCILHVQSQTFDRVKRKA